MRNFKKTVLILLVALMSASVFAVDFDFENPAYTSLNTPFTRTSARMNAMGGAGLAIFTNQDSLYINPASLGGKGLVFNTPSFSLTLYNIKNGYVDSGILDTIIEDPSAVSDQDFLMNNVVNGVIGMLSTAGRNKLATVDAGVGFKFGRFAFALDSQVNLNTYLPVGSGTTDIQIVPQVDIAATLGLGLRFMRDNAINFDVGISTQLNIRAFLNAVGFDSVMSAMNESGDIMSAFDSMPIAIGWALPLTVGVNVNFPFGFTISNVVSNINLINGGYNYVVQDSYNDFVDDPVDSILSPLQNDPVFTAKSDAIWSIGFGWHPEYSLDWLAKPTVAVDVVDLVGLFGDFSMTNFLARLKLGAELELLNFIELRAGLNGGYTSVGVGFNILIFHVEASYYWNEFGNVLGEKDVDALTLRFNLLWE